MKNKNISSRERSKNLMNISELAENLTVRDENKHLSQQILPNA